MGHPRRIRHSPSRTRSSNQRRSSTVKWDCSRKFAIPQRAADHGRNPVLVTPSYSLKCRPVTVPLAAVSPQQDTMSIVFRGVVLRRPLRGCCCQSRWQALDRYIQRACGSRRISRSRRSPRFGGGDQCGSVVCVVTRRGRSQCPGVDPACKGSRWRDLVRRTSGTLRPFGARSRRTSRR